MKLPLALLLIGLSLKISAQSKAVYYNTIDNKVFVFSKNKSASFDTIVSFVNHNFISNEDKVRAYYTWIALNISYDTKRLQDLEILKHMQLMDASDISQNADTIFRKRAAVCEGFSKLMVKFCNTSGIPAKMIGGYTKTPEGDIVTDILHAWNAVKIDSSWQLLDVTWSNGYMNQNYQYIKRFSDKYFLNGANEFVKDHLPLDPMWQLLDEPVSKNSFFNNVPRQSAAYHYNDSIKAYLQASPSEQEYLDCLHYLAFDPENQRYKHNLDVYVNNTVVDYLDLSSVYFENFVSFANSKLSKDASSANIKKAKIMLEDARANTQLAADYLKNKKAYTPEYDIRLKELSDAAAKNLDNINKNIDLLASFQKATQKSAQKPAKK